MTINNKIKGVIHGQAIGDALGLSTEFMSQKQVRNAYSKGIHDYQDAQINPHAEGWERGEWTNDTDQMLCIMDAILEHKALTMPFIN